MCCVSWGHKELDTTERLNYYNYLPEHNLHLPCRDERAGTYLDQHHLYLSAPKLPEKSGEGSGSMNPQSWEQFSHSS